MGRVTVGKGKWGVFCCVQFYMFFYVVISNWIRVYKTGLNRGCIWFGLHLVSVRYS
jgi:CRP-like cAMP-binding protein